MGPEVCRRSQNGLRRVEVADEPALPAHAYIHSYIYIYRTSMRLSVNNSSTSVPLSSYIHIHLKAISRTMAASDFCFW